MINTVRFKKRKKKRQRCCACRTPVGPAPSASVRGKKKASGLHFHWTPKGGACLEATQHNHARLATSSRGGAKRRRNRKPRAAAARRQVCSGLQVCGACRAWADDGARGLHPGLAAPGPCMQLGAPTSAAMGRLDPRVPAVLAVLAVLAAKPGVVVALEGSGNSSEGKMGSNCSPFFLHFYAPFFFFAFLVGLNTLPFCGSRAPRRGDGLLGSCWHGVGSLGAESEPPDCSSRIPASLEMGVQALDMAAFPSGEACAFCY